MNMNIKRNDEQKKNKLNDCMIIKTTTSVPNMQINFD